MPSSSSSTILIGSLTATCAQLAGDLAQIHDIEATYEQVCELHDRLQQVHAAAALVRSRRAQLWHVHQAAVHEQMRAERAAERERIRLAELEAARLGAPYAVRS